MAGMPPLNLSYSSSDMSGPVSTGPFMGGSLSFNNSPAPTTWAIWAAVAVVALLAMRKGKR